MRLCTDDPVEIRQDRWESGVGGLDREHLVHHTTFDIGHMQAACHISIDTRQECAISELFDKNNTHKLNEGVARMGWPRIRGEGPLQFLKPPDGLKKNPTNLTCPTEPTRKIMACPFVNRADC